jgi:hypothetical protein
LTSLTIGIEAWYRCFRNGYGADMNAAAGRLPSRIDRRD